jgi:hypothetical protein
MVAGQSCGHTQEQPSTIGDLRYFRGYCGKAIGGVMILPPADYLRSAR